jgi:hypothetical protein
MKSLITFEEKVGFTSQQHEALKNALAMTGMKASTWVRQAAAEKLIHQGYLEHPLAHKVANVQK